MSIENRFSKQSWVTLLVARECPDAEWIKKTFEEWKFPLEVVELSSLPDEHPWSRFRLSCDPEKSALVTYDDLWENLVWTSRETLMEGQHTLTGKRSALEWIVMRRFAYVRFLLDHVGEKTSGLPWMIVLCRRVWEKQSPKLFVTKKATNWYDTEEGFMMSVDEEPRFLFGAAFDEVLVPGVAEWIKRNLKTLLELWEWKLDSSDVCDRLAHTAPSSAHQNSR